jgi:hypothetical protein
VNKDDFVVGNFLFFQNLTDPENHVKKSYRKFVVLAYSLLGVVFTVIEIISYTIIYHYIRNHNNKNTEGLIDPSVVKIRNRINAISLSGLFAGWLMEVWYIVLVGFLSFMFDSKVLREVSTILKYYEYYLIPLVQINSSPPIKRFMSTSQPKS